MGNRHWNLPDRQQTATLTDMVVCISSVASALPSEAWLAILLRNWTNGNWTSFLMMEVSS